MNLDPSNPVPLFQQIADGIRHALAAGAYLPGDPIPSIRAQAQRLRINPNTIQRAYEQLERDGLIESRKGLGMFVTSRADDSARAAIVEALRQSLAAAIRAARAAGLSADQIDAAFDQARAQDAARADAAPRKEHP